MTAIAQTTKQEQTTAKSFRSSDIARVAHLLATEHDVVLQATTVEDLIATYNISNGTPYVDIAASVAACWQKRQRLKRVSRATLEANRLKREHRNKLGDKLKLILAATALSMATPSMGKALARVIESGEAFADALEIEVEGPAERASLFEQAFDWYRDWLIFVMRSPLQARTRSIWKVNGYLNRELKRLRRRAGLPDGVPPWRTRNENKRVC